jgi:hypothetical protein
MLNVFITLMPPYYIWRQSLVTRNTHRYIKALVDVPPIENVMAKIKVFMPPLKKRGILLCTCRSVDQKMSAQYLENLSLDCYVISCVDWWWVEEDPYWFWSQRSRLLKTGNRNILSAQYLENPLLDRLQTL